MKRFPAFLVPLCLVFLCLAGALPVLAQENSECFECHEDETLSAKRDGQRVSRYVDEKAFSKSVHGKLKCVTCHADLVNSDFPHEKRLAAVDCARCHAAEQKVFAESLHGQALAKGDALAPRCQNCHGHHDILPVKDKDSAVAALRIPYVCGSCHSEGTAVQRQRNIHEDHILENYSESLHAEGLFKKGLNVSATCTSCHGDHNILPHTDPRSSISRNNVAGTCQKCHAQIESVHRKIIRGELWEKIPDKIPVCVECHQSHKARKLSYEQGVADVDCLMCHGKEDLKAAQDGRSLFVNIEEVKRSRHGNVACAQCHLGVSVSKNRPCETITAKVDCSVCHNEQVQQYQQSTHGQLLQKNDPDAPTCKLCHGTHGVMGKKDVDSPTFPTNVPGLCGQCHQDEGKAAQRHQGKEANIGRNYLESIHGKGLLASGLVVTAMCTNCHTAHRVLPAADPQSSVARANVANTCGQCHKGVFEQYTRSVHYSPDPAKLEKLPVCSECHSAHKIRRTDKDQFRFEIMEVCGKCHESIANTYFDTFHGKVSKLGYAKTAKCHDCHGAHDILPVNNPKSRLSHENITDTCKKCHAGATRKFAGYLTHATHHDPHKYPFVFWTFWLMTALLVGTFVASGIHTLLWLPRSLQMRRLHPPKPYDPHTRQYVRFTLLYRCMHATMIVAFLTLATTGMILKFSYTPWAQWVCDAIGGVERSAFLHRCAALLLLGIFTVHLWDLLKNQKKKLGGWKQMIMGPDTILFAPKDIFEIWATLKWYVGKGERPKYGRWTYWEKFDYFAVFWGIAIIGSSGLMLWFSEFFTRFLPGWLINVATIVHSDEALLAAGFIFTIHFFNTHFRPEKFPMDTVVFTGRMPVDELARERPAEYEELVANNELEAHLADPLPPGKVRFLKIFRWIALIIGLSLVVGIMYAMIFAYA